MPRKRRNREDDTDADPVVSAESIRKTVRADDPGTIRPQSQVFIRPARAKGKAKHAGKLGVVLGCGRSLHGASEYEVELEGSLHTFEHNDLLQRVAVELTE